MNQLQDTIKHIRGKHLNYTERVFIQIRIQDGWSPYRIAKALGCCANTVRNEIMRGTPELYWGNRPAYDARHAQANYENQRINSHRSPKLLKVKKFLKTVELRFQENHWSLDACVGYSREMREFARNEMVCTRTLYNYVERGIIRIKNIDLPQKLRRRPRKDAPHVHPYKRKLGRSIEKRPACVDSRERFGDWELDLVIGSNSNKDHVLMTLLERKTRYYRVIRLIDKSSQSVMNAFEQLKSEYKEKFSFVFKTITTDNGSEFSRLSELENDTDTRIYYAHPYSSFEKGANERHNGLLRHFIPKGKRIDSFSDEDISDVEYWMNTMPRRILQYATPKMLYRKTMNAQGIPV